VLQKQNEGGNGMSTMPTEKETGTTAAFAKKERKERTSCRREK
jgi:hypothetical protein